MADTKATLAFGETTDESLPQAGCFRMAEGEGGGQLNGRPGERDIHRGDVAVPDGYRVELVARGLTFPTTVAFDDKERTYVIEAGYSYGQMFTTPRLVRVDDSGTACLSDGNMRASPRHLIRGHRDICVFRLTVAIECRDCRKWPHV